MRVQPLLLGVFLVVGLSGLTNASCVLKNGNEADCDDLENVKHIDAHDLTMLKAHVSEKTLTWVPFKKFTSSLKRLDLSDGDVQFIESGTFAKLTNLVDLKLSDNSIGQFKDGAFEGLEKLKNLDLRRNEIRHLSPALTELKALRNLEVSGNPIACDCATLKVRDELLANEVKISKKVYCVTPSHLKGNSLLEPEAEVVCMFEEQDAEMQADQAIGSGDGPDEALDGFGELTEPPIIEDDPVPATKVLDEADNGAEVISDDLIIPMTGQSSLRGLAVPVLNETEANAGSDSLNTSTSSVSEGNVSNDDFVFENPGQNDYLIVEGSGLIPELDEGSGFEGSGAGGLWSPIDSHQDVTTPEEETTTTSQSPTTEQTNAATISWFNVIWNTLAGDSSTSTPSDEKDVKESVTGEEFMTVANNEKIEPELGFDATSISPVESTTEGSSIFNKGIPLPGFSLPVNEEVVTKKTVSGQESAVTSSSETRPTSESNKLIENVSVSTENVDTNEIDNLDKASTHESKRGMGSYVVLAALLGVLAALIGFAAYKSTFCRKKPNNDPEQGAEMKDMRKALLESNSVNQAKISSNGNTENAPLVEQKQESWAEPQDVKRWPDSNPQNVKNGSKYSPPVSESEPIKPPRKSLPPQEDSNGLQEVKTHVPMSTFAPKTQGTSANSETPPNSPSSPTEERRSPPLSPGTQRVKITLQENPDSIPKTPILITRTKPGVNLVKTP